MSYFEKLGKAVVQELGQPSGRYNTTPARRQQLANIAGNELNSHLSRPMATDAAMRRTTRDEESDMPNLTKVVRNRFGARDQESIDPDLEPRGGYNNEVATQLDASDLIGFVRLALTKLDGEQREGFLMSLADLLSEDSPTANVPDNNQQSLDRGMRSGRRTARDEGNGYIAGRFGQGGSPNTKQPAQDRAISNQVRSLNAKSFDNRFGAITRHISVRG